jgi:hypothetical protein
VKVRLRRLRIRLRDEFRGCGERLRAPLTVPLMGLPLVPMTVSWPADTKLFVRGTTATRKRHSAHIDAGTGSRWLHACEHRMVARLVSQANTLMVRRVAMRPAVSGDAKCLHTMPTAAHGPSVDRHGFSSRGWLRCRVWEPRCG